MGTIVFLMSELSDNAMTFIKFYSITSWIYVINRASRYCETNWHIVIL